MTHRLLDLLNFCSKAKVVKNMSDGKRFNCYWNMVSNMDNYNIG